jgi:hypothetical protein
MTCNTALNNGNFVWREYAEEDRNSFVRFYEMVNKLSEVVKLEQYSTKSMADNTIKINCILPETYSF